MNVVSRDVVTRINGDAHNYDHTYDSTVAHATHDRHTYVTYSDQVESFSS